jgi:phage-related tail protein
VTANQTELGAKAKEYTDNNKKLEKQLEQWGKIGNALGQVGSAFSNLGSSFKSPELNIAGIVAQSVANIISAYTQAANSPGVTSTGWGWLGFALTGLAEVAAVIS